ncbi:MAG TPA: rod shape-determining protein MreD [Myxococcales bacterium]|nr:rod shape-determining protein MreD [Myxococcales bacterium]
MTLRIALVVALCFVLAVAESVVPFVLQLRSARPDLLLVVVLYLALHDDVMQGAALSAAAGYFSDLTSATPVFLYTFLAVLTFVVLRIAGSGLKTEGGAQSAVVAFGASLVHALIAAAVFGFFTGTGVHFAPVPMLWSAFGTALAAPLVFLLLRRLDSNFVHAEESGGLR